MIRNLKVLFAAALALTALGAVAASAHAADEFHCSVNPCRLRGLRDGTGATAHHVFIVENATKTESVSFTCESLSGFGEMGLTATDITLQEPAYHECKVNGTPGVNVDMRSCTYTFTGGAGGRTTVSPFNGTAEVHITCSTVGDKIQVTVPGGCTFEIGPQTRTGIGYHNLGTTRREVTVTANVGEIEVTRNAACESLIKATTLTGTYTTGNTIVTGETTPGEVMEDAWFE